MRSAVAPESRRAQASTSSIMTSATVSVPMDLHSAIEVAQHHVSSLQGDLYEMGLDSLWERGRHGLYGPEHPLPHPLLFSFLLFDLRGAALSELPLCPWSWTGLSFQEPVCPCWSLQVPGRCLKIQGHTFHTLIMELMSDLVASETLTC